MSKQRIGRFARLLVAAIAAATAWHAAPLNDGAARAGGWDGRRPISFQDPHDLFYNYYVGPEPSGTAAEMYVSPLPVPEHVGHTYNTYQPLLPHEHLYKHCRSWYTHNPGAGWTRTKARYGTFGGNARALWFKLNR